MDGGARKLSRSRTCRLTRIARWKRRLPAWGAAFSFVLLPGVGGQDSRVAVDAGVAPWSAVVLVQVAGVSRCTGVMVAPGVAATAAHCLYHRAPGRVVPAGAVHVLFKYDRGVFARHVKALAILVAPGWAWSGRPRGDDLALLRVAGRAAFVDPAEEVAAGSAVMLGGYGQDRAQRLMADEACRLLGPVQAPGGVLLRHGCAGTRGTSGGPVFTWEAGAWRLAGVAVGAETEGAGGVAVPGPVVARLLRMLPGGNTNPIPALP